MDEIFGKPGEGFHKVRFMGLALYDILGTLLIAVPFIFYYNRPVLEVLFGLFLITEGFHILFGVKTALLKNIINLFEF